MEFVAQRPKLTRVVYVAGPVRAWRPMVLVALVLLLVKELLMASGNAVTTGL
jgi:hypothetical protein